MQMYIYKTCISSQFRKLLMLKVRLSFLLGQSVYACMFDTPITWIVSKFLRGTQK